MNHPLSTMSLHVLAMISPLPSRLTLSSLRNSLDKPSVVLDPPCGNQRPRSFLKLETPF
ncbi:hypothetical protein NC652_006832 [Populus alba x Populus x berolinensis]|nr:hypothetical protein NC652_006832 [Populus alba x Populus x berolinensis]